MLPTLENSFCWEITSMMPYNAAYIGSSLGFGTEQVKNWVRVQRSTINGSCWTKHI